MTPLYDSTTVISMQIFKGTVITCDDANSVYRYLIEDKGRIAFTGDELPAGYAKAPVTDLGGKALIPSFVDTHTHFSSFALFNAGLMLYSCPTNAEILKHVAEEAAAAKGKMLMGYGLSAHAVEEHCLVTRPQLDEAAGDTPVFLVKYDGHSCVVNSAVLKTLPVNIRGLRGFNADTGIMGQEAFFAVSSHITKTVSPFDLVKNLIAAYAYLAEHGFGMVHTVTGVGFPLDLDVDIERWIGRGIGTGVQTRVFFQTMDVRKVKKRKLPRIGGCFATALDGCFGSLDAALHVPYEGTDNRGILFYSDEEVEAFCKRANRAGLQIQMHAIGDAAFDQASRAISSALKDFPREDHRHGIIHACLPTDRGMDLCAEYGIQIPVQPAFIDWKQEPTEYLESILGKREAKLNPLKTFLDRGILISGGSDAPVTAPDALAGICKACNHTQPEEALSIPDALKVFTLNGCKAAFDDKERGTLTPGKIADMTVLSANPYACTPETLSSLKVEGMFYRGEKYTPGNKPPISTLIKGLCSSVPV